MKRIILWIFIGLVLSGQGAFAADGDVQVNGQLIAKGVIAEVISVSPTADTSTASTTFVDMQGMSIDLATTGNSILLILWNATIQVDTAYNVVTAEIQVDGARVGVPIGGGYTASNTVTFASGHAVTSVTPGPHTIKLRWRVTGGMAYNNSGTYPDYYSRTLTVMVIRQ